jgi:AcrR family transcriptional regulator
MERSAEPITQLVQTQAPKRMSGPERRKRIIESAEEVVAQFGVTGATTARIAAAAGISEKSLYSHFPSRRDILIAAMDAVFERSRGSWLLHTEMDAIEHLRASSRLHWPSSHDFVYPLYEFFAAPPEAGLREELRARHQRSIELLAGIVEVGKAQGVIRADVDSEQTAWEIMGVYWAEDIAYMLGFDEFAPSGRSTKMLERILREIQA